ncbi:MAG: hypothetical protein QM722_16720 [Piscinibacter sp.]
MNFRIAAAAMAVTLGLLAGCATAPQNPVTLNGGALAAPNARIGVAMTALPKVDTSFPGASCLLCIAAASMANSTLTTHANTLPPEDLARLKELLAEQLAKKGTQAKVIAEPLKIDDLPSASAQGTNLARKDFTGLAKAHDVDKLLVVAIHTLGFERSYAAYIPSGDPKAVVRGVAFMVDLKTNAYDWYQPLNVLRASDGAWDEPAKFPGLTNAYFQAVELGKDEVLKPFRP